MAQAANNELVERFEQFFRDYYRDDIGDLARQFPTDRRSLYVDWQDLYRFDPDLADDYLSHPEDFREKAEEALRLYDLPVDVKLGGAHVRLCNLPETTPIRDLRSRHVNTLIAVNGLVRKATDVRPKIQNAAFECQRCGTLTRVQQAGPDFHEPHECQGCERQGPFQLNVDQSEFVDSQSLRIQESPEGLQGGETPRSIDVRIEDDLTGEVTPGDQVTVTGVLRIDQSDSGEQSAVFDTYMEGIAVEIEDEEFEDMEITEEDKKEIVRLSENDDIYDQMVRSIAPSIYGYEEQKLAMGLQLFSGVTKHLPDGTRLRGDLHILFIGDPGTGKCVRGDTPVLLGDGTRVPIREVVESNLDDPKPVDDGVWDEAEISLPTMTPDGRMVEGEATKVWKREAPDSLVRIRTERGDELVTTPSHPLFASSEAGWAPMRADDLSEGTEIALHERVATDGGTATQASRRPPVAETEGAVIAGRIESIEPVDPDVDWVYDLEVADTHSYVSNGVVSHNSQMLQYIQKISPRSVYSSGKGSSAAGLTAAAVRDDFGEGQQWSLEAGALVLADRGIAAIDELDKMECVTGDTLVHHPRGVERIADIAQRVAEDGEIEELSNGRRIRDVDLDVWTMADDGSIVRRPVTTVHEYDAPSSLTEVTLSTGESLTSTDDHPYFVFEDGERVERPASDLDAGDWVYVPREVPSAVSDGGIAVDPGEEGTEQSAGGDPPRIDGDRPNGPTPAFGAVLGYLSGDGNVYYDRSEGSYGIRFTNAEEQLLADFERACRTAFDAEPSRPPSDRRADGVETVRLSGKEYADRVIDAGMNLETYDGKSFPAAVSTGSRATKAAFVRSLADSEGNVDTHSGHVRIASSSCELLVGAKSLLSELGVSAQIETQQRAERRVLHSLTITDADSLAAYAKHVGFTLDRKQSALADVVESASGDRTILDVVPDVGDLLADARESLRLYQRECGIDDATYCNFETGVANVSIHRARRILDAFEERKSDAKEDAETLDDPCSWDQLAALKEKYHVSQSEIATETSVGQHRISRSWGEDDQLRDVVRRELSTIVETAANTDLSVLRELVDGDVKWRQVDSVESIPSDPVEDRIPVLREQLTDVLGGSTETVMERARRLLDEEPVTDSWDDLHTEMERHDVSMASIASDLDVAGSTVSRWFGGVVDTDRFEEVRASAEERIDAVRDDVARLVDAIEDHGTPKVYDLTVEDTHNFLANGLVVHNSDDRSAMHEALEQQSISISKAGINATLKSRCSLLGAANPKYGRFDQYEPIGEQIDLEPALISRFDLIFTVTDKPDEEEDRRLADHILTTNYAGELNTQREEMTSPDVSREEVESFTDEVDPDIDPTLFRKYVAYAKQTCHPRMTEEAREEIKDFYTDLRAKGTDEDAPVPVTARQLEAIVRLAEASARVRLSDRVTRADADRVIDLVRSCLQDVGVDPESGEFDADVVETGTSKSQRDRIKNIKGLIADIEEEYEDGAPVDVVLDRADEIGLDRDKAEHEIDKLKQKGEVYEPSTDHLRTT